MAAPVQLQQAGPDRVIAPPRNRLNNPANTDGRGAKKKEISLQNLKNNIGTQSYWVINIFTGIFLGALIICLVLYIIIYIELEDDNNNDNNFKDHNIFSFYQGLGVTIAGLIVVAGLILTVYNLYDKDPLCLEQKFLTDFSRIATTNLSLTDLRTNFKNYLDTKIKGDTKIKEGDIRKFGDMLSGTETYLHQLPAYSIPSIFYDKVKNNGDFNESRDNYINAKNITDTNFREVNYKNLNDNKIPMT